MKEQMTPRDRIITALGHRATDIVPMGKGFGINAPALRDLAAYLNMSVKELQVHLWEFTDIISVAPDYIGPTYRNSTRPDGSAISVWGVERKQVSYGNGSYSEIAYYPLNHVSDVKELDSYEWPSAKWWDFSTLKDKIKNIRRDREYAIMVGGGNIYESSWYMRGFEQMFIDLITEPELAWEIMTRVTDYFATRLKNLLEAADGMIDIIFTADDIGQQQGLLMSMDLWEKMLKPHHTRLNKIIHEYGVKIMYHSDGAVMEAVPGFIDMEIDILEALQFDAKGMDPVRLKNEFGDKLCFHGGISVQSTLPFGTTEDVIDEVKKRVGVLGKDGGYILAPSHAIQAGTPPANITAYLEAGRPGIFSQLKRNRIV